MDDAGTDHSPEEMGAAVDATLGAADTVLLGRKTYDASPAKRANDWPARPP